jgi:hypothetical protein
MYLVLVNVKCLEATSTAPRISPSAPPPVRNSAGLFNSVKRAAGKRDSFRPQLKQAMRMSDEQVLPLQYFNIFCVSKGLIEKPGQHILTAASGPRAEALALVLPDSELPAFWTLHRDDIN